MRDGVLMLLYLSREADLHKLSPSCVQANHKFKDAKIESASTPAPPAAKQADEGWGID